MAKVSQYLSGAPALLADEFYIERGGVGGVGGVPRRLNVQEVLEAVSSLAAGGPAVGTDEMLVVRAGDAKKLSVEEVLEAISSLAAGGPAVGTDEMLVVRAGDAKKLTLTEALALAGASGVGRNAVIGGCAGTNPWQLGTAFAAIANAARWADCWSWINTTAGVVTAARAADAPTVAQAGVYLSHCFHIDVTTADVAIAAADYAAKRHHIEGYVWRNFAQRALKMKFWHKCTKTGTQCVALHNGGHDRYLILTFQQAVSDTWEEAELDVPASPSAGTWDYEKGAGLHIDFVQAAGTNFHGAAGAWAAGDLHATAAQVNNLDSVANDYKIENLRLFLADGADPDPYDGDWVAERLERYCEKSFGRTTTPATGAGAGHATLFAQVVGASAGQYFNTTPFRVRKRDVPTMTFFNPSAANAQVRNFVTGTDCSATALGTAAEIGFQITANSPPGSAIGHLLGIGWLAQSHVP